MLPYIDSLTREHSQLGRMITVWPFSNLTKQDLAKQENVLLLLCSEAAKSRLVKLETSHTVILPKHQAA